MKSFKLTVFTEPVAAIGVVPRFKSFVRPVKFFLQGKKSPGKKKYGGHYAVTRSLVEGLQKTGADFNYNPANKIDIAENVIVLAGVERLKEAIELKKKDKIKFLLAGPNIVDNVLSEDQIAADPAIDYFVAPSEWVKNLVIEDCINLKDRVLCWSAGVNSYYWKPGIKKEARNEVLIYWKTESGEFYHKVVELVKGFGMQPVLIKYGDYTASEFRKQLDRSQFAIFISRSESQGIALAEAWSMDVPTLVFDPGNFFFGGRIVYNVSSCPYLTELTGITWKDLNELRKIIQDRNSFISLRPRNQVLKKFTDEYRASQLLESIIFLRQKKHVFL
jgi:hypothetical protein